MPIDRHRVQVILFDIDGTLRDTDDELVETFARRTRSVLGRDRSRRVARRAVMAIESPTQLVLGVADRLRIDGPLNRAIDYLSPRGRTLAVPGVVDMIDQVRSRFRIGVVSAGPERAIARFLDEHDLTGAMEIVVAGSTYRRTKPHPMPLVEAARELSVPIESALMVGDTTVDIEAGLRAGAQTLGVLSGFGRRTDLLRAGAHDIADTAAILPRILGIVGGVRPA